MTPERLGSSKWVAIAAGVAVADLLVPGESLSSAFRRARESEHPAVRVAAIGGLALTAAHLLDLLPANADPFNLIDRKYHAAQKLAQALSVEQVDF
jgi:hypothetical protein